MSKTTKGSEDDKRQFWQMAIDTWAGSGLSVRRFCRQEGLSEPSFYSWRKKLAVNDKLEGSEKKAFERSPFIEVSMPDFKESCIELVLVSGNTLKISPHTDKRILSDVVMVLKQAGLC